MGALCKDCKVPKNYTETTVIFLIHFDYNCSKL